MCPVNPAKCSRTWTFTLWENCYPSPELQDPDPWAAAALLHWVPLKTFCYLRWHIRRQHSQHDLPTEKVFDMKMWFSKSSGWGRPVTSLVLRRHFNDLLLRIGHPNFFYICTPRAGMFAPLLKCASAHWFAPASKIHLFSLTGSRHDPLHLANNIIKQPTKSIPMEGIPSPCHKALSWVSPHLLEINVCSEVPL